MNEKFNTRDEELVWILESIRVQIENGVSKETAVSILKTCLKISNETQLAKSTTDVRNSLALFLNSEIYSLHLLRQFKNDFLPLRDEVRQLSESKEDQKFLQLNRIREMYPYAVRSVHNPHIYLPVLQDLVRTYGTSTRPVELDWQHEVGHFSRYQAQKNGKEFRNESQEDFNFLCILYRNGDYLGYQPAVMQDESSLTTNEKINVLSEDGDLSRGDILAIDELNRQKPLAPLRHFFQNLLRK